MKKINILVVIVCVMQLLLNQSCSKFLDLKPKDQRIVTTIEDYRDIMASYVSYIKTVNPQQKKVFGGFFLHPLFDVAGPFGVYAGEINISKEGYNYDSNRGEYTTDAQLMLKWMKTDFYMWDYYYRFLGNINLIISDIVTAKGDNEALRNYVRGEALVWRAFSYFKILQYYSPYKDNKFGIPVHLNPYQDIETIMPPRLTQTEVYAQIIADCKEALALLEKTASTPWNCAYRYDFVNSMLSSVYLYKAMSGATESDDWSNAVAAATEGMKGRQLTNSIDEFKMIFNSDAEILNADFKSDEFSFRIMDGSNTQLCNLYGSYVKGNLSDGIVNSQDYSLYIDGDKRKMIYFNETGTRSDKYNLYAGGYQGGVIIPFRLAEVYLNKAEALVRTGDMSGATAVLQEFINSRYEESKPNINGSQEEILSLILNERRREFYLENDFRWLDMKRLGVTIDRVVEGETVSLQADDFRYTCPIPSSEMKRNKNMVQTPGWENITVK